MEVICLQDKAFYALVEEVVARLKERLALKEEIWVSEDEAKHKLGIKAKSTLQELRNAGEIRYSQRNKKPIMYDVNSIYEYLERYAKNTF